MSASRTLVAVCTVSLLSVVTRGSEPTTPLLVPSTPPADAAPNEVLPFPAVEKTLPNGLKIIVVRTGFPNIVSLQIPVNSGSRNEIEAGKTGFAHFFEHMMFRGTRTYPPDRYQGILTRAGARQNAYTDQDFTNYHTTFAKEDLETMIEIEADRFKNLEYSVEGFKTESRAILGEYNKNSSNPIVKLDEVQRNAAFTTHTYKHTGMGFIKDVEDMPNQFDYARTFFERWYRPEYTTIIVAGDVDPAAVIPLVEKYWGDWKRGSYTLQVPREPEPRGPVYAHVPWESATLPWLTAVFHGPAFSDTEKDFAAMSVLLDLHFGETSDLYKRLVEQEQKVDALFTDNPGTKDPELSGAYARVKKVEDLAYVRDEILKTFALARSQVVPAKRLADAKSNLRYSFVRSLDNTERIGATLARFVRHDRSFDTLNKVYRVYASLTPEDLLRTARKYFQDRRLVMTTLAHEKLPETIGKPAALATLAPRPETVRAPDKDLVRIESRLPQVVVKLLFPVGSAHDPKGKEGLAQLAGSMVSDAGSKEMRIDEINRALYPMAGSLGAQVDREMTTFTLSVHRDNWKAFADAVLPMLLETTSSA